MDSTILECGSNVFDPMTHLWPFALSLSTIESIGLFTVGEKRSAKISVPIWLTPNLRSMWS